jgi:hypothetical protein
MTAADAEAFARAAREQAKRKPNGQAGEPLLYFRGEDYRRAPQRDMVIKGLLGRGELSVWYGPPKSGKSFLVTDLALAVAEAVATWFGHRIKGKGFVVYCVMEGAGGFPNRLRAWSDARGRPVPDSFVWVPLRLNFLAGGATEAAAADVLRIQALVEHLKRETGLPCVLIVVDTVARAMTGADENSTQDMGLFLDQCAFLQELFDRPHVLVVHHENAAGSRTRGSSALNGGGHTFVRIERTEAGRAWSIEAAKDDADGERHGFALQRTVLGDDEDGDEVTSCILVEAEAPTKEAIKAPRLTDKQRVVLECLDAALVDHGESPPPARDIPRNSRGVRLVRWCEATLRYQPGGQSEHELEWRKKQSFYRTAEALQAKGLVRHVDGWCWKP